MNTLTLDKICTNFQNKPHFNYINKRFFMVPHLVRTQSTYISHSHTHTHHMYTGDGLVELE